MKFQTGTKWRAGGAGKGGISFVALCALGPGPGRGAGDVYIIVEGGFRGLARSQVLGPRFNYVVW